MRFPTYNWEGGGGRGGTVCGELYLAFLSALSLPPLRWQRRLRHMAQYFTAYRIDHILGFFRIWEIPGECTTGEE